MTQTTLFKDSTPSVSKRLVRYFTAVLFLCFLSLNSFSQTQDEDEAEERDGGPAKAAEVEYERTKDPLTGRVPRELLLAAIKNTIQSRTDFASRISALNWIERGPNSDVVGPSNGNTRANNGNTSGRMRAIMVDSTDVTHKTVFVGGVDGGLWKTADITVASPVWTLVNDFLSNLAISGICQDPRPGFQNIMYFCTGESYSNSDAVRGNGVFKSTNGGTSWTYLPSTSTFVNCTRILCDFQGNIYLATRGSGLQRSTAASGGAAWTNITPTGLVSDICDLEISSTSVAGRLHLVSGIFSNQAYRYTDIPSTVVAGTWTAPAVGFPSFAMRAEIACNGNTLYSLVADLNYQVPTIYKSTNGGADWAATTAQPTAGWASGQGWYALAIDIDPSNANNCIIGGLNTWKTTTGGAAWSQISTWVGTSPVNQYVHADVHKILWYDGGNKLLFGCDGGIHYSADKGATIRDRNTGLRIKQFYSCAIHPTTTNYFLAGAQDNGVHQFNSAGLSSTVEVTGGDGAFVAIDQNQGQFQFGSYVYNAYRRSINSGSSWSSCNFYKGTSASSTNFGSFINAFDYDNTNNIIYGGGDAGEFFRWTTAQTTSSGNYYFTTGFPAGASIVSGITGFNSAKVSAVFVSPYTANQVYFGTASGRVVKIAGANTAANGTAGTNISGAFPTGTVSSINAGTDDQNLMVTFSNYSVNNVWVTTNGGTGWTAVDGNLPNMPVRWCMFYPGSNTKAYIATETGVWETDLINGASTVWVSSSTFPVVRTDMIKYRSSDRTMAAATHGRGLWTTAVACLGITITNPATTTGTINTVFSQSFSQTGAVGGATFTLNTGTLPAGLTLSAAGLLSGTPTQSGSFPITVKATGGDGCIGTSGSYNLVINAATNITLNLKLFLQGYYIGNNVMQPVLNNQAVASSLASQTDTITIQLHHATTFALIDTKKAVLLTNGTVSVTFTQPPASYYIAILHRNNLQTWSATAIAASAATPLYDFTTAANKAFGNNQVLIGPGVWGLFTGDINQDEFIDGNDFPAFDNDSFYGVAQIYITTDLNGDGFVDGNDFPVFDNNSFNGVSSVHP